jgi:uncharacterized protein
MESEMDQTEQQYIDALFDRLSGAERQGGPRDAQAERYIQQIIARQPGLIYYMTQTLIVQDEALKAAQQRLDDMEREMDDLRSAPQPQQSSGGFLGGLFGGGGSNPTRPTSVPQTGSVPRSGGMGYPRDDRMDMQNQGRYPMQNSPMAQYQPQPGMPQQGGGFLAGAMQTAAGVAGGVLLGNMLGDMFGGEKAGAAQAGEAAKPAEPAAQPEAAKPEPAADQSAQQNDPFANVENTQYDEDDSVFGGGDDYDI